jgi:Fe-S cluster assembly protein SufB
MKSSFAHKNAEIRWVDCNMGSKLTIKYPAILLASEKARGEVLLIAIASDRQIQDMGDKMIHLADYTTSHIIPKSISKGIGLTSYKGIVHVNQGLKIKKNTQCDAVLNDERSRRDTYPKITVHVQKNNVEHEARASKIDDERLCYLPQHVFMQPRQ